MREEDQDQDQGKDKNRASLGRAEIEDSGTCSESRMMQNAVFQKKKRK